MSNQDILKSLNYLDNLDNLDIKLSKLNLKSSTHSHLLSQVRCYRDELGRYKERVDSNYDDISVINGSIQAINTQLTRAIEHNTQFTSSVRQLLNSTHTLQSKLQSTEQFLETFTLPPQAVLLLSSKDYNMDYPLLDALTRLNDIRHKAQLLHTPTGDQSTAALDILHTSSPLCETAYVKICKYLKHQFDMHYAKRGGGDVIVEGLHVACLEHLAQRDDLYHEVLVHLAKLRRMLLQSQFLTALANLESNEDIITHPVRFAGELLAWLHQHAADEKELMSDLLAKKPVEETLSSALLDVSRRIRLHLTHALSFTHRSEQLTDLIGFYKDTLTQSIPVASITDLFAHL
ncbi:hypothetical protein E3P92_01756 [Wallemia ichthyophaga]|uniref:Conserved oligomeric Golgi complex subunit 6 n=1 Tax=Wallemia ichthyophaga TaxID=245174 RepID=A0A4V4M2M9_WALIC|nr:hypothetical protein E3P91_01259 [Wallemia ichthyophaga]TIA83366.1 hypothetical protein E3P98_00864 [Wallemia ichthyophaga]TIB14305.1 hypothetical protein E3P90_01302 [Wallemia ichthyophaga]TIB15173.1 hypothetical protein E3P92_01756 [Wallemia ichthyophaga]TIB16193.1 hypothetical protein E3P93_01053 [Wallemia ichthyophaga]